MSPTPISLVTAPHRLAADITIQTFMRVTQLENLDDLPHHYALLACPTDDALRQLIAQHLAEAHITAVWYPED